MSSPERPWWSELGERVASGELDLTAPPVLSESEPAPAAPGAGFARTAELDDRLPEVAWITALSALPEIGPARLHRLLDAFGPRGAWSRLLDGSLVDRPDLAGGGNLTAGAWRSIVGQWQVCAARFDVASFWARHVEAGVGVAAHGSPAYPRCLVDDPEPPAVLFHWGRPAALDQRRVAIVGTRRCSERAARVAECLGFELSRAGVGVVSGLALGIDGAAHRGALRAAERGGAPPIGVVASGLDVVYPPRHRSMWQAVADAGVLLTEVPLGVHPNRWRFPARNRIIAGLAEVVVVVETPVKGGSMHTVDEAERRGVTVMAVPSAVGLRAGAGTNGLLRERAVPVLDTDDVLVALGLATSGCSELRPQRPPPDPLGATVLDALGWRPASLPEIVDRVAAAGGAGDPRTVVGAVVKLGEDGWLAQVGGWFERVAP